jgi:hypothetical protein
MSGTTQPAVTPITEDTRVDADTQARLLDYWRRYGPNAGAIMPMVVWDNGATRWDGGATVWPY